MEPLSKRMMMMSDNLLCAWHLIHLRRALRFPLRTPHGFKDTIMELATFHVCNFLGKLHSLLFCWFISGNSLSWTRNVLSAGDCIQVESPSVKPNQTKHTTARPPACQLPPVYKNRDWGNSNEPPTKLPTLHQSIHCHQNN